MPESDGVEKSSLLGLAWADECRDGSKNQNVKYQYYGIFDTVTSIIQD